MFMFAFATVHLFIQRRSSIERNLTRKAILLLARRQN